MYAPEGAPNEAHWQRKHSNDGEHPQYVLIDSTHVSNNSVVRYFPCKRYLRISQLAAPYFLSSIHNNEAYHKAIWPHSTNVLARFINASKSHTSMLPETLMALVMLLFVKPTPKSCSIPS